MCWDSRSVSSESRWTKSSGWMSQTPTPSCPHPTPILPPSCLHPLLRQTLSVNTFSFFPALSRVFVFECFPLSLFRCFTVNKLQVFTLNSDTWLLWLNLQCMMGNYLDYYSQLLWIWIQAAIKTSENGSFKGNPVVRVQHHTVTEQWDTIGRHANMLKG